MMNLRATAYFAALTAMHTYARDLATPDSWSLLIRQTDTFHQQGKLVDAERSGRMALLAARGADSDERLPITHAVLASVYRDQGRCSESRTHYARAAALYQKQLNPRPKYVFNAIVGLIGEACECDDVAGAQRLFRLYAPQLHQYRSDITDDAKMAAIQGGIDRGQKHYAAAEQEFRQAIGLLAQGADSHAGDIAELRSNIALMVGLQGRPEHGIEEMERAIVQMEAISPRYSTLPAALNNMGNLLAQTGRLKEAGQMFQRAVSLAVDLFGEENRRTAMIMMNYAVVLRSNQQEEAAAVLQAKAQKLYQQSMRREGVVDVKELEAASMRPR